MFNIVYKDDISLQQLIKFKKNNESILRTAHIGNFNKQTNYLASLGFDIYLLETLKGNATGYMPSYIIKNNKITKISGTNDDSILQLNDNNFNINNEYIKPSQYHWNMIKKMYDNVELCSTYLIKNYDIFIQIVKLLIVNFPQELEKYVDNNGDIYLQELVEEDGIVYKFNNKQKKIYNNEILDNIVNYILNTEKCVKEICNIIPSGIIMNSKYYLFIMSLIEIITKNKKNKIQNIYHFSGTQMINYLYKNKEFNNIYQNFFNKAYKIIKENTAYDLPECVNFNLISTDFLDKIIVDRKYQKEVNELAQIYKENKNNYFLETKTINLLSILTSKYTQYDIMERKIKLYNAFQDISICDLKRLEKSVIRIKEKYMYNFKEDLELNVLNHSCAHLLAQAVKHLYPHAKFWVGPVVESGFYYDIDLGDDVINESELEKIEKEMKRCSKDNKRIVRKELSREEALDMFKDDPYKIDLINNMDEDTVISAYTQGDFTDLCRGPHVETTKEIKYFKLIKFGGAYYKGDSNNKMLQRIYGVCFKDEDTLNKYLTNMEEAKLRDHRRLGKDLDLFMFDETAPGMPYWLPKGLKVYNQLVEFWRQIHEKNNYFEFSGPMLNSSALWKTSGHWEHYKEDMFVLVDKDGLEQALKPMSCPNSILVYKNKIRSYKDLPLRFCDVDAIHRNENSASLHGLLRVRVFHQDDSHNFIRQDQIFDEISSILDLANYFYDVFGLKFTPFLSTRPDDYMGDLEKWNDAEEKLIDILNKKFGDKWILNPGDGAFYGPKIDLKMTDALGREWQTGTIQLDYQLPEKFDLSYIDKDGNKVRPIMVHRTIYGSLERFIGILIEHFAGAFPLWLAPVQISILPVNNELHTSKAKELLTYLESQNIRCELNDKNEKLGFRIRETQMNKIPITIVMGDNEVNNDLITYRLLGTTELKTMSKEDFMAFVDKAIKEKTISL